MAFGSEKSVFSIVHFFPFACNVLSILNSNHVFSNTVFPKSYNLKTILGVQKKDMWRRGRLKTPNSKSEKFYQIALNAYTKRVWCQNSFCTGNSGKYFLSANWSKTIFVSPQIQTLIGDTKGPWATRVVFN